jgi:hypothetical protein
MSTLWGSSVEAKITLYLLGIKFKKAKNKILLNFTMDHNLLEYYFHAAFSLPLFSPTQLSKSSSFVLGKITLTSPVVSLNDTENPSSFFLFFLKIISVDFIL